MGTKRKHDASHNEVNLSVPPGFVSLTSLTLKRINTGPETADSTAVGGECKTGLMSSLLSSFDVEKFKSSFIRRPWICRDQFDRPPQKYDSEQSEVNMSAPNRPCLPKGVTRGCLDCHDCVKVTARWHPKESRLPAVDDAPVFQPTEEEFKDTLKYIAQIRVKAENYGICRIVPPPSWRPPCLLEDKNTGEASRFSTRVQKIDRLKKLYSKRTLSRFHEKIETKKPEVAESRELEPCFEGVADSEEANSGAATSDFEYGPIFTLKSFKNYADDFKRQYFLGNVNVMGPDTSPIAVQDLKGLLISSVEGEYWRIIENPSEEIEVLCGTNLRSGFPVTSSQDKNMAEYSEYVESGWNLNNIPKLSGSLLPFGCYSKSTISVPQLFVGMCFTSQCWRNEDHHLYSLSYMHLGEPKVWYGIPGRYCFKFVEVVKKLFPQLSKHPKLLYELVTQLSPSILMSEGIPVYRCVQNLSEFVVIFPGAYHSEFSSGFNCSEAVCFAPFDWLPHGQNIVELYAGYCLKTLISHDKILFGAAMEAVSAQWEYFTSKKESTNNQIWRSVSGKDGILTRVLKTRVTNESIRKQHLCNFSQSKAFDEFDVTAKRECSICYYDLFLSAVNCSCSPSRYSCLRHAKELCSCAWDCKCFFFRYEMTELNLLVEALEGHLKATHSWAKKKAQPDSVQQMEEQNNPDVIFPRTSSASHENGIASKQNLMPASDNSFGANEDGIDSKQNIVLHSSSSLSSPSNNGQNVVKSAVQNVVIHLSDDED